MKNLNLLFNKTYYEKLDIYLKNDGTNKEDDPIKQCNTEIRNTLFNPSSDYIASAVERVSVLYMKTSYPGVLVGTGYAHGAGIDKAGNDINCGFSFDYVSGQPYIPGSSVKGLLRSAFTHNEIIKKCVGCEFNTKELENAIFGSSEHETEGDDVFLDAVIRAGDTSAKIVDDDYLTPHPNPIKNPIPIHILRIKPKVIIEFRFVLTDTKLGNNVLTANRKLDLFSSILQIFGIGAKTNVGYGVLHEIKKEEIGAEIENRQYCYINAQKSSLANNITKNNIQASKKIAYKPRNNLK